MGVAELMQTNIPTFTQAMTVVRRRFQDFEFLRDHLVRNFPACVVPPIPDKHRLGEPRVRDPANQADDSEYVKGDRFSPDFVERRRLE
jgi:sorting nexin-4